MCDKNTSSGQTTIIQNVRYQVCAKCGKPIRGTGKSLGGVMVLVCKDYIKARKRVPLSDDTVTLCESLGFVLIERIQAMLKEKTVHNDLFVKEGVTTIKSRASFFRRLAEKKGAPPIDWEDVLIFRNTLCSESAEIAKRSSADMERPSDVAPVLPAITT